MRRAAKWRSEAGLRHALQAMRFFVLLTFVLAMPAWADSYPSDAEVRTLHVGDVIDITPPGVLLQIVCDRVGELVEVDIGEERVTMRALAPGVTACSFYGQQDRDEYWDEQRSGVVEYRALVKYVIEPRASASEQK